MERIYDTLLATRKTLFFALIIIIAGLFVKSHMNDIRYEVKYLEESYAKVLNKLENASLVKTRKVNDEKLYLEFKDWSDQQLNMIQREIKKLRDNVESAAIHSGVSDEKLTRYDLALESSGGRVVSFHKTQLVDDCSPIQLLLGGCHRRHPPEKAIQSSTEPGQCFCFKGEQGDFTIRLGCEAVVDAATLEHIPRRLSPTQDILSAPKKFKLTGFKRIDDEYGIEYGTFEFDPTHIHKQIYSIAKLSSEKVRYVKMSILENHGDKTQTCVYRIQLHGFVEKC